MALIEIGASIGAGSKMSIGSKTNIQAELDNLNPLKQEDQIKRVVLIGDNASQMPSGELLSVMITVPWLVQWIMSSESISTKDVQACMDAQTKVVNEIDKRLPIPEVKL